MEINKYPDGTSYVTLEDNDWKKSHIFRINTYEDLHHLEQFVEAYNYHYNNDKPTVIIPNLIDAQADRRFGDGQSSGLKIVLKRLNSMNASFKIFHPHNAEVVEAMMDNVEIIDNSEFISEVLTRIYSSWNEEKLMSDEQFCILTPDAGMYKYFGKIYTKLKCAEDLVSSSKIRKNGKVIKQQLPDFDFEGKDILIIDDISVYGGTFKGLANLLRERNCGKLYLAVSHMSIQNLGEDPVTNYFDKVFTTNSKFNEYCYQVDLPSGNMPTMYPPENLEIIKLF